MREGNSRWGASRSKSIEAAGEGAQSIALLVSYAEPRSIPKDVSPNMVASRAGAVEGGRRRSGGVAYCEGGGETGKRERESEARGTSSSDGRLAGSGRAGVVDRRTAIGRLSCSTRRDAASVCRWSAVRNVRTRTYDSEEYRGSEEDATLVLINV